MCHSHIAKHPENSDPPTLATFGQRASVCWEWICSGHSRSISRAVSQNILIFIIFFRTPQRYVFPVPQGFWHQSFHSWVIFLLIAPLSCSFIHDFHCYDCYFPPWHILFSGWAESLLFFPSILEFSSLTLFIQWRYILASALLFCLCNFVLLTCPRM